MSFSIYRVHLLDLKLLLPSHICSSQYQYNSQVRPVFPFVSIQMGALEGTSNVETAFLLFAIYGLPVILLCACCTGVVCWIRSCRSRRRAREATTGKPST